MSALNRPRFLRACAALAPLLAVSAAVLLVPIRVSAQAAAPAKKYSAPRLPDGRPDFSGYWTNNTATPLVRPDRFKDREFLRPDEVESVEKATVRVDETRVKGAPCRFDAGPNGICPASVGGGPGGVGDYNAVFLESGKKVVATLRTSIITDPKDGRMPPMLPEAQKKAADRRAYLLQHPFDSHENLTLSDRCIMSGNAGPPMLPGAYNNNYHIVQGRDFVGIESEMMHDFRPIPIDGRPHGTVPGWKGDSIGHYEGDTLVVETTNFNGRGFRGNATTRVTERFTRTAPDILLYQFTVEDPAVYTRPYSGEITMWPSKDPVYEYACHEGNYSMPLILSGARAQEREAATKGGK